MNKSTTRDTVGFGCPNSTDPHHFVVEIPAGRVEVVSITEHYGIKAGINGLPEVAERCFLPRLVWSLIAEDVKREFNERLRSKKMSTSRWTTGSNKVERLLGKELLVLAWAVERVDVDVVPNAVRNWIGLRPEERWWLFTATSAATGGVEDSEVGWRKALRYALTENPLAETIPSAQRKKVSSKLPADKRQGFLPGFQDGEASPFLSSEPPLRKVEDGI